MRVLSPSVKQAGVSGVEQVRAPIVEQRREPPAQKTVAEAPIPSGADLAKRKPGTAGSSRLFDVRLQAASAAVAPSPTDGLAFTRTALADIRRRTDAGEKVRVVFDLDNTLFDTRVRTFEVARAWDRANGTNHFSSLTLDKVGRDAKDTCARLGLPADVAEAFGKHWDVAFWSAESLAFDAPMASMVKLAKQAADAGADVVYLTGRIDGLKEASLAQLVRAGLPDADRAHLFCKPGLETRTAPFKSDMLDAWQADGFHIAWFATEGRRDIAHIQKEQADVPCLLLNCTLERHGDAAIKADTPLYPGEF